MNTLHLYCVVSDGKAPDPHLLGFDGGRVATIRHGAMAALVSRAPVRAYRSMRREEVFRYLAAHQAVVEKVMEDHTVVPVKFGTTARDEAEVRRILERGYSQLKATLEAIEGEIELDLVAQWKDLNSMFRQIGEEAEIQRQKAAIAVRPVQETTEERIRIGRMVKARLDQMRGERAAEIVEALNPLVRDICPHALLDDRMILNTAFLVDRAKEKEFSETLERLNGPYTDSVDFRCVGPLPPYSFATVEIKTFKFETIDRARCLLGLQEDAGLAEIRDAYRRLVQQCHPDHVSRQAGKAVGDAAGPFEAVTEAYRLLGEYRRVGSSFRARDVREAVAVRLLQRSPEPSGA
ncbi:MAG: GvpL/GvpF family gas vesicle protein [Candidatus Omnitrophica bacterium]|nr:GvpL/GvpF family gas vesicle protein [Candidatus Omnitrophota bacterium]